VQPDTVVINGDWLDMSEWSDKFAREPGFFFTTQPALFECHYWLQKLRRTLPNARIVYIEGNHEIRLKNSMTSHLLALAPL
jgi:UDP-2,3-diacylglucosamine pyrophosphatase LpxH